MINIGIYCGNQLLILKIMCQKIVILVRPDKPIKNSQGSILVLTPIQLQVAHE